ncbi:MAG: hypothetical protein N2692_01660 [Patescibacteria group bacterium]|jgi:Tfp pilus assembly protein PilO|nr:hypothetical protein [Patescibacteria group bacterium]
MKETTKRNFSLILTIIFFLISVITFFNYTWPNLLKVLDLNDSLKLVKEEYARQSKSLQLAKDIINQYKNLSNVNQMISLTLPKTDELFNVLAQLDKISSESGILIQNITIKPPLQSATSTATGVDGGSAKASLINAVQSVNVDLSMVGTYESFKTWLNAIETNIRLMDVTSINFTGVVASEKTTTNIFNFRVNLNFYYQP